MGTFFRGAPKFLSLLLDAPVIGASAMVLAVESSRTPTGESR
jgi:hypothetical protein